MNFWDYPATREVIDGYNCRVYRDNGVIIKTIRISPFVEGTHNKAPLRADDAPVSQLIDPTTYHREYYRKVRSKRDQRAPRGPYKPKTQ